MTKREICEKEMDVLWNALLEADGGANNTMMSIASAMKELLLDLAAPEEEDRDPYNTGMHDEYDLDENGCVKAVHTCENEPKPETEVEE